MPRPCQAFKMGIPLNTRHREVAPNQYECAPYFGIATAQIDENLMVRAAAPCNPGCSPVQPRLQPYATQAATRCDPCCMQPICDSAATLLGIYLVHVAEVMELMEEIAAKHGPM